MKKWIGLMLAMLLLGLSLTALADEARVTTPGGWLNLRRQPTTKSGVLKTVPNHSVVTYHGTVDDTWSKVTYKGVTGYVQTKFITVMEDAEGKILYADGANNVYIRQKASENSKVIASVGSNTPLTVLEYGDEWVKVECIDQEGSTIVGYIPAERVADRYEDASSAARERPINEYGEMLSRQKVYDWPDKSTEVVSTFPKGQSVLVLALEGSWCRVQVDFYIGYVPASSVKLTGEQPPEEPDMLTNYVGVYYQATVPSGSLNLYVEPTGRLEAVHAVYNVDPQTPLNVLQIAYSSHGNTWAKVVAGDRVLWTLSSSLSILDEVKTYQYPANKVSVFDSVVFYAGENGTTFYSAGSRVSDVLGKIPAGTELTGDVRQNCVATDYNGQMGYVFYDEIVLGLADTRDEHELWYYWQHLNDPAPEPTASPTPNPLDQPQLTESECRAKADAALKSAYGADADDLKVTGERYLTKRGFDGPLMEFAYYKGGKYVYCVVVHAVTGEVLYKADYTAFKQTSATAKPTATPKPPADEITSSRAKSIAESTLSSTYGGFSDYSYQVVCERFDSIPGYEGPVFRIYYNQGEHCAYICIVSAKTGNVLHHTDVWDPGMTEIDYSTPTPEPTYESTVDIGQSAARSIGDSYLAGKYPDFASAQIGSVSARYYTEGGGFEPPYYYFDYFAADGELLYSVAVHGYTGRILYYYGGLPGEGNG